VPKPLSRKPRNVEARARRNRRKAVQSAAIEALDRVWTGLSQHQREVLQDTARDFTKVTLSILTGDNAAAIPPAVLEENRKRGTGLLTVGSVLLGRSAIEFADILLDQVVNPVKRGRKSKG